MSATRSGVTSVPGSQLSLGPHRLLQLLQAEPVSRRRRMLDAAQQLLQDIAADTARGRSVLQPLIGHRPFVEWEHYPRADAVDARSGYRFFYHAHAAAQRLADEHGHFHVFGPSRQARADGRAGYVHLAGISVDARGFPLRVFTTNRWVTDEHWQQAAKVQSALHKIDLSHTRPAAVARWVQNMTRLFAPQIAAVVARRDARIAARCQTSPSEQVLEDRRSHIVSQCRVDLGRQLALLERAAAA